MPAKTRVYFVSFPTVRVWEYLRMVAELKLEGGRDVEHGPHYMAMRIETTERIADEIHNRGFHVAEQ